MKTVLTMNDVLSLARAAVTRVTETSTWRHSRIGSLGVYPVPRGGIPAALAIAVAGERRGVTFAIVGSPEEADIIVDDLVDSGATRDRYMDQFPDKQFLTLINKQTDGLFKGKWIVFPWEQTEEKSIEDQFTRVLQYVGEDANRGGLLETPARVARAWKDWTSGYDMDAGSILKVFEDGAEAYDQMVTVKDIPIYSHCEHHMAAIFGTCTISYIPNGKIVGLSKLSRLADMYARRLQVQERLTDQIADALHEHLQPVGVGVVIRARHMCMESRGVCQQGHHTITTSLRGAIRNDPEARTEFLQFAM